MKDSLENRIHWEIGFIRTLKMLAKRQNKEDIELDFESVENLVNLLEECEEFVKT